MQDLWSNQLDKEKETATMEKAKEIAEAAEEPKDLNSNSE
jgi:hypothetical protein